MYEESDLLALSGLQHLMFCARQWGLITLEGIWEENRLTAEGRVLHERADRSETEVRGDVRIARGLRIHSLHLGLAGRADVVEFHKLAAGPDADGPGAVLPRVGGQWRPYPVEYKRGRPKAEPVDLVQLCAQALCLEEMLGVAVPRGAMYYGKTARRLEVAFDPVLRADTAELAARMHALFAAGRTPPPEPGPKCRSCSLVQVCRPEATMPDHSARAYLEGIIRNG